MNMDILVMDDETQASNPLKKKIVLPKWIDAPIPGKPETFDEAKSEYNNLLEKIGITDFKDCVDAIDSESKEKMLAVAKTLDGQPEIQRAMRLLAGYL